MIQSMTGYGKSEMQLPTKKITVEIKSLNSKNLDLNIRIPNCYKEKELTIRQFIAKKLRRGKIDFTIYIEKNGEETTTKINEVLVKQYINQLKEISDGEEIEFLKMAIKMPEAFKVERYEVDEEDWKNILIAIEESTTNLVVYRNDEGSALEKDLLLRIKNISEALVKVEGIDHLRIEAIKVKLRKALTELKTKINEDRFEQELIYYLEKLDINEEKVRLKNHLLYFVEELNSEISNGKKLGFITQEIGREINTIGSKSNFGALQKLVVQMKDELEKIKEQLLNIL